MNRGIKETAEDWYVLVKRRAGLLVAILFGFSLLLPTIVLGQEDGWSVSGLLRLQYKGKYLTDDRGEDHKLFQTADITVTENKWNHFRFTFSGDLYQDLDGKTPLKEIDWTRTIRDTWDDDIGGFLYIAQAELHDLDALEYLRLGRQYVNHELYTTHLDGVNGLLRFGSLGKRVKPFFYIGVPVRLYEDKSSYFDASEFGGGVDFFMNRSTRITYEHRYTDEDVSDHPDTLGSYRNPGNSTYQQSAFAIRHNLFGQGYGYGSLFLLNNKPRWVNTVFSTLMDRVDLEIDGSYLFQFEEIENMPTNGPLYTGLVGPTKPYHFFTLDFQKAISDEDVWISAGTQWRVLDSSQEDSAFNHSYHRQYLGAIFENFTELDLQFSVQAEYWAVFDNDYTDSIVTLVGGVGYDVPGTYKVSVGTSYSLFKYDYFFDVDEKQDVYTVQANGRYYIQPGYYLEGRYDLDIYDIYEHRFVTTIGVEL